MYILIDDVRELGTFIADPSKHITLRSFDEAMYYLTTFPVVNDTLLMDNDLGELLPGREGYDILNYALETGNRPKRVVIVSSNPVGRQRMHNALKANDYTLRKGVWKNDRA